MAQKTRVELNISKFTQKLWKTYVLEQNRRLVEYAKITTQEIGDRIKEYNSRHNMDRTGNLLDSLSWGVSYRGQLVDSGYYQNRATRLSYLHEFSENWEAFPVGGHTLAEEYIRRYGAIYSNGWRVFFTIRAPYWAYWEKGFEMKVKGKSFGFRQFSVMTQFYDKIGKDLKPAKVTFRNKLPAPYFKSYRLRGVSGIRQGSLERKWNSYSEGKSNPYGKYSRKRYRH